MVRQEARLSCPGFYNNLGASRAAQVIEDPRGCGVVGQNSWESVKGLLSVRHLSWNWLWQLQTLPYKCLAHLVAPGHANTHASSWALPANQRGGHQGERQRCRHAWVHTLPGRPARGLGQPEGMGALDACQVPNWRCWALGTRLQGCPRGLLVEESHRAMAWSLVGGCPGAWRLLRGACSLEALAGDVVPGRPEM